MKRSYIGVAYYGCDGQWQSAALFQADHDPPNNRRLEDDLKRDWAEVWKEVRRDESIIGCNQLAVAYERMRNKGWTVIEHEIVDLDMDVPYA